MQPAAGGASLSSPKCAPEPVVVAERGPTSIVQVRNCTTGVAVSLLKKSVVKNRLAMNRDKSQCPFRPLGQAGGVNSSEIKPDGPLVDRMSFVEDFIREHSSPILHMASIGISGIF
jgi:hypothetical protein